MNIADISKLLSSHNGRDKIMRTISYSAKLASTLVTSESHSRKLQTIGNELSACRTVLRLFDDIPMLNYTLTYGLGKEEPDLFMRILGVLVNAADQLYFPLEHIAWASDNNLISVRSSPWWTASTACWALSLYLSLMKVVRYLSILQRHKVCLRDADCNVNVAMAQLLAQQRNEIFTALRCIGDLAQAVHYLPEGFLWSGKLKKWQVASLGLLTSLISLYQTCQRAHGKPE